MPLDLDRFPREDAKYMVYWKIQLVVSRLFAGDNRLSLDFLLVTTGCEQTLSRKIRPDDHQLASQDLPSDDSDREGRICLSHPRTNNRFSSLLTHNIAFILEKHDKTLPEQDDLLQTKSKPVSNNTAHCPV